MSKGKSWRNNETEITLHVDDLNSYELCAIHSGFISPTIYGLYPEDTIPEELEIEIHGLAYGYKNNSQMTELELQDFLDKYEGLIGDEILSKFLD